MSTLTNLRGRPSRGISRPNERSGEKNIDISGPGNYQKTPSRRQMPRIRNRDVYEVDDSGPPASRAVRGRSPRLAKLNGRLDGIDSDSVDERATKTESNSSPSNSPAVIRLVGGPLPKRTLSVTSLETGETSRSQALPEQSTDALSTPRQAPRRASLIVVLVPSPASPGLALAPEQTPASEQKSSQITLPPMVAAQPPGNPGPETKSGIRPAELPTDTPIPGIGGNNAPKSQLSRGEDAGVVFGSLGMVPRDSCKSRSRG